MVRNNMTGNMPVNDPEYITCWENLEYAILKLEEEQFNLLLSDRINRTKQKIKVKKMNTTTATTPSVIKTETKTLQKPVIENDFITEMERMFENGDTNSVIEVLKSYEKK